jgi:crotonobetainyl-CoA:carnitine CoA-transferase CaiB-like acyl-CoA transferase
VAIYLEEHEPSLQARLVSAVEASQGPRSDTSATLVRRLVEQADVVIENFSARVLEQFDLGWETLSAWNPRLVVVRMPAWGLDGPWRDRTGFAMNIEQACGIAWRGGFPDQPICANVCDPIGGLHALIGLFAALEHRRATGRGQQVEVPLVEPGLNLAMLGFAIAASVVTGLAFGCCRR